MTVSSHFQFISASRCCRDEVSLPATGKAKGFDGEVTMTETDDPSVATWMATLKASVSAKLRVDAVTLVSAAVTLMAHVDNAE